MKAIWNGSLALGLINIPIRVYPASEEREIEFHMLHKKDHAPIRFARICKEDGEEIAYSDIVKGYEFEKGQYVVLEKEDFEAANAKKTSTIEIQHFTNLDAIDPIYFAKPYFLEPDRKAAKACQLLNEALKKSKKVALASFVFRNREHIGVILPSKDGLILIQMRYYSEIRDQEELKLPKETISSKELKMALALIDELTEVFDPKKYHDTYASELMGVIEQKLKGKKSLAKTKKAAPSYQARDLMNLLQESMKKTLSETKEKKKTMPPPSSLKKNRGRKRAS